MFTWSMQLFSFIIALRAARRVGEAERKQKAGDTEGVMNAFAQALELYGKRGVDFSSPGCRAGASLALWGYCEAAHQLGRKEEIIRMLNHWRPTYQPWLQSPVTRQEREFLGRTEKLFQHLRGPS